MLVLAAGGDPHRDLDLDSVAVERLAAELDAPERRDALVAGLGALEADGLPNVAGAVELLVSDPSSRGESSPSPCSRTSWPTNSGGPERSLHWHSAVSLDKPQLPVAFSSPEPRRRVKLSRNLTGGRRLQPYSRVDAPFFRSQGFFVRIGGLAIVVGVALCVLVLRAWSIQILHGPAYTSLANGQAYRNVDLVGPRGAIVDAKERKLVGTTGHVVIAADVGALGEIDAKGWHPTTDGLVSLRRMSHLVKVPVQTLVTRIRRSVVRSPFAPATVLSHPGGALIDYLEERGSEYPGFKTVTDVSRSYPQGAFGSEFLGLLGEVSPARSSQPRYAHAKPGETWSAVSGIEADVRPHPERRACTRAHLRGGLARPRRRPARVQPRRQGPAEAAADDRRAHPARRREGDRERRRSRARERPLRRERRRRPSSMNPWTGAVYALASYPTYNQVAAAHDPKYLASLYNDPPSNPRLLNQATQGQYPTGSTFKPIVAEAALAEGMITPTTPQLCSGSFTIGGFTFHNVEAGVYSSMSLPTALAESCDTWFYRLGDKFPARRARASRRGRRSSASATRRSSTCRARRAASCRRPRGCARPTARAWYEGQTINLVDRPGLPPGDAAADGRRVLGARERRYRRAAARCERDPARRVPVQMLKFRAGAQAEARRPVGDPRRSLLRQRTRRPGRQPSLFANFPVPVAGKTGTAEARHRPQRPFVVRVVGAANNPKVVVVVLVAHGGFGAQAAGPAARDIYSRSSSSRTGSRRRVFRRGHLGFDAGAERDVEAGARDLVRDRQSVLHRHLRHHDEPAGRRSRDVDVEPAGERKAPHERVRLGERALRREDADDLALPVLHRRCGLLEGDGEARLPRLGGEARAVGQRVGAVDLDLEVAAAVVLDLDTGEPERGCLRLQLLRRRERREVAEDGLVVLTHLGRAAGGLAGDRRRRARRGCHGRGRQQGHEEKAARHRRPP